MELILTFSVNLLAQVLKVYVAPRWGETGVQVTVFAVAILAAASYVAYEKIEGFKALAIATGAFFASAIVFYEILLKRLSFVKSTKQLE